MSIILKGECMEKIKEILSDINVDKILDVATGRGEFVELLKNNIGSFNEIIGIDNHKASLKIAQEKNKKIKNIKFIDEDIFNSNLKKESFQMVTVSNSLHHFKTPQNLLKTAFSFLKKDGYFIISEMHRDGRQTKSQKTHIMIHHWGAKIDMINNYYHEETFTHDQLVKLADTLTLKEKKVLKFSYPFDENSKEEYKEYFKKGLKKKLSSVDKKNQDYQNLKKEMNEILKHVDEYGFATSEMTFIIGRK